MKLASIEKITEIISIPGADRIVLAKVLGFQAVVVKDSFNVNDKIVFIQPDTILPDTEWAAFYKAKSNRVKAIKLKKVWSQGIIESLSKLGLDSNLEVGAEVSNQLNINKYEPPVPKELNAKCSLRFGLFKTDEERAENLDLIPYGELVTVTLKIDGQSASYFAKQKWEDKSWECGITSRSLELKPECVNNYTLINNKYDILNKLQKYCIENHKNYCLRAEIFGNSIQNFPHNPHCKQSLDFAVFNLFNLDSLQYEPFYKCIEVCNQLNIPIVPIIEKAILTPELIKKYSEDLQEIDGKPFEGVVIKLSNGKSFKIINKTYDSKK